MTPLGLLMLLLIVVGLIGLNIYLRVWLLLGRRRARQASAAASALETQPAERRDRLVDDVSQRRAS